MSNVFAIDTKKQPLNPIHPGHARRLLKQGKAAVWRRYPFTLILKDAVEAPLVEPLRVKIDPGSKTTGIALVNDATGRMVVAAELSHRGDQIKKSLDDRRALRRSRRQRHTRYRKPRFQNRKANVLSDKKSGVYIGRVAVLANGSFNITGTHGTIREISARFCVHVHAYDGYSYVHEAPTQSATKKGAPVSSPCLKAGVSTGKM